MGGWMLKLLSLVPFPLKLKAQKKMKQLDVDVSPSAFVCHSDL